MKKISQIACLSAISIALLSGCAGKSGDSTSSNSAGLPDWVMAPEIEGGIAATSCVPDTNNLNLNRSQAMANARANLAKEIGVKVQAMDKEFQRSANVDGQIETGGTFESVSRQVANQYLTGSRPAKTDYVDLNGQRNLCVMVTLQPEATKKLFDQIIKQSSRAMSPAKEDVLYEEFRAAKAQNELIEATR